MKRTFCIHPFVLSVIPTVFVYSQNIGNVSIADTVLPILLSLLYATGLLFLCKILFKSFIKASVVTSWVVFLTLSYGYIAKSIPDFTFVLSGLYIGIDKTLMTIFVLVTAILVFFLSRTKYSLVKANAFLNFFAIVFLVLQISTVSASLLFTPEQYKVENTKNPSNQLVKSQSFDYNPNIYYIILDAYARADILQELYDCKNSDFLNRLEQRGFYIATNSNANYCQTGLSLASSLNLEYHDELAQKYADNKRYMHPLNEKLNNNKVINYLKEFDYEFNYYQTSDLNFLQINNADAVYYMRGMGMNILHDHLYNMTIFPLLFKDHFFPIKNRLQIHRKRLLYTMEKVESTSKLTGPFFDLIHILCPHRPFVFDRDGNFRDPAMNYSGLLTGDINIRNNEEYKNNYCDQLLYLSMRVLRMVDRILDNSQNPPIIILQADHGPSSEMDNFGPIDTNTSNFKERMGILNAYFFPDQNYSTLYSSITPVNTFRVILNQYFDGNFEFLPDSVYFSNLRKIYNFKNVTSIVNADSTNQ